MNSLNQSTIFSGVKRVLLPLFASAILSGAPSGSQAEEITHDTVARVESTIGKDTLIGARYGGPGNTEINSALALALGGLGGYGLRKPKTRKKIREGLKHVGEKGKNTLKIAGALGNNMLSILRGLVRTEARESSFLESRIIPYAIPIEGGEEVAIGNLGDYVNATMEPLSGTIVAKKFRTIARNGRDNSQDVIQLHVLELAKQDDINNIKRGIIDILVDPNLSQDDKILCIADAIRLSIENRPTSTLPTLIPRPIDNEDVPLDLTVYRVGPYLTVMNSLNVSRYPELPAIMAGIAGQLSKYCTYTGGQLEEINTTSQVFGHSNSGVGESIVPNRTRKGTSWSLSELDSINNSTDISREQKVSIQKLFRGILIDNADYTEKVNVFKRILDRIRVIQNEALTLLLIDTINKLEDSENLTIRDLQEIMSSIADNSSGTIEIVEGELRKRAIPESAKSGRAFLPFSSPFLQ